MKAKGPGNYLLVAPTFRLLDKQAVPTLNRAFATLLDLGQLVGGASGEFRISESGHRRIWPDTPFEPTRIIFGYAENSDSLESLTGKGAWLDECGQRSFKKESHEAIQARLAIHQGRILYTSTPYQHGWLKSDVYDRAERNRAAIRDVDVAKAEGREPLPANPADIGYDSVSYESRMNPQFRQEEWDRQKLILPGWRFDMRYRGRFTRPAGQIYNCFDPTVHKVPSGYLPDPSWKLYCGLDFGAPHFCATFIAEEPGTKKRVAFAEYRPQESKKVGDHVAAMHAIVRKAFKKSAHQWSTTTGRPVSEWTRLPDLCVGGSPSEGQWRTELSAAGWPVHAPDQKEVEVGIARVFAAFAENRLLISEDCPYLLDDVENYSREVDEDGEPISDTICDKEMFHSADSCRYLISYLDAKGIGFWIKSYG
jgi:hypothetical protein